MAISTVQDRDPGNGHTTATPPTVADNRNGKPRRSRLRAVRTFLTVVVLLAGAAFGGTYVVRQRLAARMFVDIGTAVLTADPIPVGSADAGVVTEVLVSGQVRVTAGQDLARIRVTANGTSPTPPTQILRAPVAGTVSAVNVNAGSVARAGEPVITLYDQTKITFQAQVPISQLRQLRLGMTAAITGPGISHAVSATLDHVVPRVGTDPLTGNDRLTVVLAPQPDDVATVSKLVPGLQFNAIVNTNTAAGWTPAINSA